jgi:hypothetical protein
MVHSYSGTIFDPKCQGSSLQRDEILQVVGAWHQGVRRVDRAGRVTKRVLRKAVPIILV